MVHSKRALDLPLSLTTDMEENSHTINHQPITYYYDQLKALCGASYGPNGTDDTRPYTTEPASVTSMFWNMVPGQALLLRLPQ